MLSDASLQTLAFQGGSMTESEAIVFEQNPYLNEIIAVRRIDEQAKISNKALPESFDIYKQMMIRHLQKSQIE